MRSATSAASSDLAAELALWAAALTGRADEAAALIADTLASPTAHRASRESTAGRDLLARHYVNTHRGPTTQPAEPTASAPPDELEEVEARLAQLDPAQRACLTLAVFGQVTHAEIAGILDRPPAWVARQIEAATRTLDADPYVVRATLDALSWRVPDPAALRRARHVADRRQRRARRRRIVLAGAAVLLVLALGATSALRAPRGEVRQAGDWSSGAALALPAGWQVQRHLVAVDHEVIDLAGQPGRCALLVSLPSTPEDARPTAPGPDADRVRFGGRRGLLDRTAGGSRLTWGYAPGATTTLTCSVASSDEMRTLAEGVSFRRQAMLVPWRIAALPTGFRVQYAVDRAGGRTELGMRYEPPGGRTALVVLTRQPDPPDQPSQEVLLWAESTSGDRSTWKRMSVGRLYVSDRQVTVCRPLELEFVCLSGTEPDHPLAPVPGMGARMDSPSWVQEMLALLNAVELAPTLDPATWFDAATALPNG